ncbi:hypothetical protein [Thalassotalea ganghwensis]
MKQVLISVLLLFLPLKNLASELIPFEIYDGIYKLTDGRNVTVTSTNEELLLAIDSGSLLEFADIRADSRVIAIEEKTAQLMNSTILNNRKRIAELFVKSPGNMDDYIDGYFDVIAPALALKPKLSEFEVINTTYRDEDSDYGYGDKSWGWETFTQFARGDKEVMVRIVWDGVSGHNVHRGTGKLPVVKEELNFKPRKPSRSWVRVYSPDTQKIQMVRELPREQRKSVIPARFIAYDIDTHNTVGIRFRKENDDANMVMEIGPLGSDILKSAHRISMKE